MAYNSKDILVYHSCLAHSRGHRRLSTNLRENKCLGKSQSNFQTKTWLGILYGKGCPL